MITLGLFMQSKCLYRISSLYEKRIDTTGEESIGSKFGVEMLTGALVIELSVKARKTLVV